MQVVVECRDRLDGKLLWMQREELSDAIDVVEGIEHIAEERTVQVLLGGGRSTKLLQGFDEQTGRLKYQITAFERLERKDVNGDGCKELCIYRDLGQEFAPRVQLTIAKSLEGEQWRALDEPYQLGSDFDQDGVQDLLVGNDSLVRAVSGTTGVPLWTYRSPAPIHAWRLQTYESSMSEWTDVLSPAMYHEKSPTTITQQRATAGMAARDAWDIDHDGTGDVLVQTICKTSRAHSPVLMLSGRTGKVLWRIGEESGSSEDPPRLQPWDLNGDGKLEVLRIHASRKTQPTAGGPSRLWDATLYEAGAVEPIWTRSFFSGDSGSVMDQMRMVAYPRAQAMKVNADEYWDLLLVTTENVLGVTQPQYCWTVLSGKEGVSASPRLIHDKGDPLTMLERSVTVDVDGDGRRELLATRLEEGVPASEGGRFVVLELWDASNREKLWEWKYRVHDRYWNGNDRSSLRPHVIYSRGGSVRFALALFDEKSESKIILIDAKGETLKEMKLDRRQDGSSQVGPCWIGDVNGDGDQDLLVDDHGLLAIEVWKDNREWKRYDVQASDPSMQLHLVHIDSQNRLLQVSDPTMRWVQAWKAETGDRLWTVHGPRTQVRSRSTESESVQVLQSFTMEAGWVQFHGDHGMHSVHLGHVGEGRPSFMSPSHVRMGRGIVEDVRWKRPLPWAQAVDLELGLVFHRSCHSSWPLCSWPVGY